MIETEQVDTAADIASSEFNPTGRDDEIMRAIAEADYLTAIGLAESQAQRCVELEKPEIGQAYLKLADHLLHSAEEMGSPVERPVKYEYDKKDFLDLKVRYFAVESRALKKMAACSRLISLEDQASIRKMFFDRPGPSNFKRYNRMKKTFLLNIPPSLAVVESFLNDCDLGHVVNGKVSRCAPGSLHMAYCQARKSPMTRKESRLFIRSLQMVGIIMTCEVLRIGDWLCTEFAIQS